MANRNFPSSRVYGFHLMPVRISGRIAIGASGAVTNSPGQGIQSMTHLGTGIYRIQLNDNYSSFIGGRFTMESATTGSPVAAAALVPGTLYQITTLGTTTTAQWVTAGFPPNVVPSVGAPFVAAATSGGTGTATAIGTSGITNVEIVGGAQTELQTQPFIQNVSGGAYITIQCLAPTSSSVTTRVATDPISGAGIGFELWMNNSSVQ